MNMRQCIAAGKTFYDYVKFLPEKPTKTDLAILQVRFEEMQDALRESQPKQRKRNDGQFIVISTRDNKPIQWERKVFRIFQVESDAANHGKMYYEYRQFRVMPFLVWKNTFQGRSLIRMQRNALRATAIMPAPIPPPPQTIKTNKGIKDTIQQSEHTKQLLTIKGDTVGVARINQQINKLKGNKPK